MERDSSSECRAIVMEYLLHYCYKNSAQALLKDMYNIDDLTNQPETNSSGQFLLNGNNIIWSLVDARKAIHQAIQQGDIELAFVLIEEHFPLLVQSPYEAKLNGPHYILHKLRCQQFVETLRSAGEMKAIQFAQNYLRPQYAVYRELTDSVTCIIAYKDFENDKTRDITSQASRDVIADQVNEMILESNLFSPKTTLEKLWRQKTAVQVELDNQIRQETLKNQKDIDTAEKEFV